MSATQQVPKLASRFSRLSIRKKLFLAFTLIALISGAIVLSRFQRPSPMEPVPPQPLDPAELAPITARLTSKSVPFKTDGDKLLVPADKKLEVLADLLYEDLLPGNTDDGFDAMFK